MDVLQYDGQSCLSERDSIVGYLDMCMVANVSGH